MLHYHAVASVKELIGCRADNGSVGHGSNESINLGESRGSRVSTVTGQYRDPLTMIKLTKF